MRQESMNTMRAVIYNIGKISIFVCKHAITKRVYVCCEKHNGLYMSFQRNKSYASKKMPHFGVSMFVFHV
jgi:hypothetical protein